MSTIDNDLTDEERAKLQADAAAADPPPPPSPSPTIDEVIGLIQALPDVDIVPSEQLAPVFDAIARTEPLLRDQLAAALKAKVRRIKACTIDAEIDARVQARTSQGAAGDAEPTEDEGGGISADDLAKMRRRCMAAGRPAIFVTDNEAATVDEAIERLAKRAPWVFVRDCRLVSVRKGRVVELPLENVRYALSKIATFVDATGPKLKVIKGVPMYVDAMVRARGLYTGMRDLAGVATTPILHADASVFAESLGIDQATKQLRGYDPTTRQVYLPAHKYPVVSEALPTLAEAQAAAAEVLETFGDFPVREECDRAAILALVLTLVGRHCVDGPVPGFLAMANAPRVGKGKLIETAAGIAYGVKTSIIPQQKNDDELEKKITGVLRKGRRLIAFDNLTHFGGPIIDALLTARLWDGRTLGTSDVGTYDVGDIVVTGTANNARLIGDASQRVLPIRLHTDDPHPETRSGWKHALPEDAIRDHVRLHVAALTVLRYGLTLTGPVKPWGSFEAWCQIIRRSVIAVLGVDPCDTRSSDDAVDETAQTLGMLLTALHARGAGMEWTATRLLEIARGKRGKDEKGIERWVEEPDEALNEALSNLLGDQRRAPNNVGVVLKPHKGRKVQLAGGTLAALSSRIRDGVPLWSVVCTEAPPPPGGVVPDSSEGDPLF